MTSKLERLTHSRNYIGRKVYLPNEETSTVTHTGGCDINTGETLKMSWWFQTLIVIYSLYLK